MYNSKQDDFEHLPDIVKKGLGKLEFAMALELDEKRKLARVDVHEVLAHLNESGFYIQLPPQIDNLAWWDNKKAGINAP